MTNTTNAFRMMSTSETDPRAVYSDWQTNAVSVRRNWMEILGFSPDEINEDCVDGMVLVLDEELKQYNAACRLSGHHS